jgi:methyltransferase (TIGR00027 family)
MEPERPSRTAALVAFLRAVATLDMTGVRGFSDPTAAKLLPTPFAELHGALVWLDAHGQRDRLRRGFGGYLDTLPLRTLAIDAELRAAVERGAAQVVILGAGLDGRAWRMPELSDAVVFEVDHPATQADKRGRARALGAPRGELRFVAVDFERDSLDARLAEAGHDPARPTAWVWEGVITYLTLAALRGTLATVAQRSAPTSRLLAQYRDRSLADDRGNAGMSWVMSRIREPHIGQRLPAEMAALLEEAGLRVLGDSGAEDWLVRFDDHAPLPPLARATRLAVAERV